MTELKSVNKIDKYPFSEQQFYKNMRLIFAQNLRTIKAAITQNETSIPSLHCLCIMREKLLQRSWFAKT